MAYGAAALTISACGQTVTAPVTLGDAPASGWAIDTSGDLNAFFDCLEGQGATLVAAHRGGPAKGFPENAVETMAATLAAAPALMEIDVATSSDGALFLNHDDTLDRTTTGSGPAGALSWAEIQKLKLRDNDGAATPYRPSRFDEALAWADGKTILEIDFKRSTSFEAVAAEIARQRAERRVILIAYTMAQAEKLHRLMPDAMISLSVNSQSELNRAVAAGVPDDHIIGFTGTEEPRPRLFATLNNRKVEVIFATLGGHDSFDRQIEQSGDDSLYGELSGAGVDIIATDRPREAQAALETAGRAAKAGACGILKH
ncbi:MAG: glycerophosphodiester phosphodiesterase family protein [Parvularculaceae bacterium]